MLYINVNLDHREDFPGIHRIAQVGPGRWNRNVEVKSLETAKSRWLGELIKKGFEFSLLVADRGIRANFSSRLLKPY